MDDIERFVVTCLPCPICKLRFYRGAAVWVAAQLCVVCKHCQYHCRCGPAQCLEEFEPIEGIPPEVDEPVVVDANSAWAAEDSV
jgi:hypothetical protein